MSLDNFAELRDVEVFSVGRWRGSRTVDATSEMLDDMVRSFNELSDRVSGFRPPLKLGHEDAQRFIGQNKGSGAPALGWVRALRRVGDKIVADFSDVPSSLLDMIRKRLYNHVSIEILPSVQHEGAAFKHVLTAVALLGAELPAVKGLKELSATLFDASGERPVTLSEKEEEEMPDEATYTQAQVDALVNAAVQKAVEQAKADGGTALSAAQGEIAKLTQNVTSEKERADRAEVALDTFKAEQAKAEIVAAVDAAIKDGKVLPAEKDTLIALGQSMTAVVKFGDKEKPGAQAFKDMLAARPKVVKFGQKLDGKGENEAQLSDASAEVDRRTRAKISADGGTKLSYRDAMTLVLDEDPALKSRYIGA